MNLGRAPDEYFGLVNPPVGRSTTITYPSLDAYENPAHKYRYGRLGNPISDKFEQAITAIEGGFGAISASSGLSAITAALTGFVKAGDHILVADSVYPPTRFFCNDVLSRFGVEVEYYDPLIGGGIADLIRDNTAVIYMESPGSGTFDVQDVLAIAAAAKARGVITMIDNTWSAGILFKPLAHGVNISIQSATKYIAGHADVSLGVAVADSEESFKTLRKSMEDFGHCAAPDDLYMGLRGLRTITLRLKQSGDNALKVAQWLQGQDGVQKIYHVALEDDAGHEIWKRDYTGANGLLSILLQPASKDAVRTFIESLELFPIGSSWGGYESILQPQYMKKARSAQPWAEEGFLVRLHIGLEDTEDLIEDLSQALKKFGEKR